MMRFFRPFCHISFNLFVIILFGGYFSLINFASASVTDGTIDSTNKYAWGENVGWFNFGTSEGNVHITSSSLTGYIWEENVGWISLNCSNTASCATVDYKVTNNGGSLSGYAWGENIGWINFAPTYSGVSIDENGIFSGYAWGENVGWISLNCSNTSSCATVDFKISTDWRPLCNNGFDDEGDGRTDFPDDPGCNSLSDNTENSDFANNPNNPASGSGGTILITPSSGGAPSTGFLITALEGLTDNLIKQFKKIPKVISELIPEFLKPTKEIALSITVPRVAPFALNGFWQLIAQKPLSAFVLAPLPQNISVLARKLPQFQKIFSETGISKITDVKKLTNIKLNLPVLSEAVGLPKAILKVGDASIPVGIPIANLSVQLKQKLPSEILFVKTAGELINFNVAFSVSEKGETEQKIQVLSGQKLRLAVKPDGVAKSVKGYIVFKNREPKVSAFNIPVNDNLLASLFFARPVFAQPQEKPIRLEEKLVLGEFDYLDEDGDGIYIAEIDAPQVDGEYEIITLIDYFDADIGRRAIRLTTVIDPEGYVFERDGDRETRIPGAIISLFWLNPSTKQYELWPSKEFQQENPQVTDIRGSYAFLVPEGSYYLRGETPGYLPYDGKPFQVKEGSGVHINIELRTKYWWLKVVDFKTAILIVVIMMLLYNFYRDKMRDKKEIKNGQIIG